MHTFCSMCHTKEWLIHWRFCDKWMYLFVAPMHNIYSCVPTEWNFSLTKMQTHLFYIQQIRSSEDKCLYVCNVYCISRLDKPLHKSIGWQSHHKSVGPEPSAATVVQFNIYFSSSLPSSSNSIPLSWVKQLFLLNLRCIRINPLTTVADSKHTWAMRPTQHTVVIIMPQIDGAAVACRYCCCCCCDAACVGISSIKF